MISVLNRRYRAGLDLSYVILRTKKNFKGDHIPLFLLRLGEGQVLHEHSQLHLSSPLGFFDEAAPKCPLPLSPSSEPMFDHQNDFSDRSNSRTRTISSSDDHSIDQSPSHQERLGRVLVPLTPDIQTIPTPTVAANPPRQDERQDLSSDALTLPLTLSENLQEDSPPPTADPPTEETALDDTLLPPSEQSSPMASLKIPFPEMYSGWMKRQEGNLISSFVKRYFVLEKCVLTCYEMSADTPPYGRNPRGVFQLTHVTQIDLISTPATAIADSAAAQSSPRRNSLFKKQPKKKSLTQTQLLLSDPLRKAARDQLNGPSGAGGANDPEEYLLELESIESHARWVQALLLHIEYCATSKRRFSMP